jgi:hypothetical protein
VAPEKVESQPVAASPANLTAADVSAASAVKTETAAIAAAPTAAVAPIDDKLDWLDARMGADMSRIVRCRLPATRSTDDGRAREAANRDLPAQVSRELNRIGSWCMPRVPRKTPCECFVRKFC